MLVEQRVTGSALPGPLAGLFPLPLSLDISQAIKEMETGPIDSVTLRSLKLTITATAQTGGDTDDWSFVESVHVFVESSKAGSALPRLEIASVTSPGAVTTMTFDVDESVNLNPYVNEGSVVEGESAGTVPQDDVTFDGAAVFTIHPL
jgi:hypothetical protein